MAEIGGSPTDSSVINLDNAGNDASTSNVMPKEGAIKRQSEVQSEDAAPAKKKKSAEELAGTSRGRNVALKKALKAMKKKQQKAEFNKEKLLENRDRLLERLKELNEREMLLNDRAEEREVKKQEEMAKALVRCELALKHAGLAEYDEEEQKMIHKSLSISHPDWPCLDTYIQDFVLDRLYEEHHRDKGTRMTTSDLTDMINKVRSRDATIRLPDASEMDRLLAGINCQIAEAVHERVLEDVIQSIADFPDVHPDAPDTVPDTAFSCPRPLMKVKQEGIEAEREELNKLAVRVISACVDTDEVSEKDLIILDDEDNEKEGDDDEMADEEEVEEEEQTKKEEEEDNDIQLVNILSQYPEVEDKAMVDDLPEENANGNDEEMEQNESVAEKTQEEKERADSRDGKEIMEGGTSTNSPTLERDERMKEIEKIEDTKQKDPLGDSESVEEVTETNGATAMEKRDIKANVSGNTIVLDDDDEDEVKEERKAWGDPEEGKEDDGIHPPTTKVMTAQEAWRIKLAEIQTWVNKTIEEAVVEEEEERTETKDDEMEVIEENAPLEEEEDDEIKCIQDDFEMDSVSHSGLPTRRPVGPPVEEKARPVVEKKEPAVAEEVEVIELD